MAFRSMRNSHGCMATTTTNTATLTAIAIKIFLSMAMSGRGAVMIPQSAGWLSFTLGRASINGESFSIVPD
jgi:hypothetical protein